MPESIIKISQLTKTYKSKEAVRQVDLTIYKGEIVGVIGQNGAGKSTLLKMMGGLIHPTSGEIHLFNQPTDYSAALFERMGLLIEDPGLYPNDTAYEHLYALAISRGLKDSSQQIERLLQLVGLDYRDKKTKVKHYSMGMKQRLGIALALLGRPDVLILDEPINGLDPQGIVEIRNLILELSHTGLTVIMSSHMLEELSKIATKYVIIHKGEIVEVISSEELLHKCEERIEIHLDDVTKALPLLEQALQLTDYKVIDSNTLFIYDSNVKNHQLSKLFVEHGLALHSIIKHKQSLEQYFLSRTQGAGGVLHY